ncbi:MAG: cytochrome C oxidase subunit IV family protein [Oscillochloridaceae bacterium]|nr:cytochrome C oxidase subunit IV family protein [Chloroflexaceae bacterium]MDW8390656.1 cytochrome C oxidase subunit IV family protein [Oscillochloridaceae bacterium]
MAKTSTTASHGPQGDGVHPEHVRHTHISRGTYYKVFGALMALMALTVGAWWIEGFIALPRLLGVAIAMAIAIAKTTLIVLYFMHVKVSERATQAYAAAAFIGFAIMVIITMVDYFARGWPPPPGPLP